MSENTITLDLTPRTQAGLAAVIPFASTDDVTPVLVAVQITDRRFLTTDRYAVGSFFFRTDAEGEEAKAFVVPLDLAIWVAKHKIIGEQRVIFTPRTATIVWSDDSIAASTTTTFGQDLSAFIVPPVARLIPEHSNEAVEVAPFGIAVDRFKQLVKASVPMAKIVGKPAVWRFQTQAPTESHKLPPIRASLGGDDLVVLIQPSTVLR